jgi:NAD(P)H-flavin reductase/hemoglobin-like flavoprotein
MALNPRLIRDSFALVEPIADKVSNHFYALLFLENPRLREMFPPMMDGQRSRLVGALVRVVGMLERPGELVEFLQQLGRDHRKFDVRPEHYDLVGHALMSALRRFAGPSWTPEIDEAWREAYHVIATTMIAAADDAARTAPAAWSARVVAHELRAYDIAVITLQPDQRLHHRAGQYVSVETARWPRIWRSYSIANAPREDGTITLHVRAVGAGWVSGALVRHTQVGDVVRLGPAMGSMVCNSASARDVLCVAGGTGLAPLKAIIEDMAKWNTNRKVRLFVGVRRPDDLYDLDDLERLAARHSWLSVRYAISHDPRYAGESGMVSDVLARHGVQHDNWTEHDVYVSGSAPMVRATIGRLQELAVPLSRMHFDVFTDEDEVYIALNQAARDAEADGSLPDDAHDADPRGGAALPVDLPSDMPTGFPTGFPTTVGPRW